jgi:hypothetical protein
MLSNTCWMRRLIVFSVHAILTMKDCFYGANQ